MRRRLFSLAIGAALAFSVLPAGAVPTPIVAKNLELLTSFPDVAAVSTAFSTTSPTMYVSTLKGIVTYDISTPTAPKVLGALPLPNFENERMTLGERADGTKFVLVGLDQAAVTPTKDPTKPNVGGYEFIVVDVTNPAAPAIRGRLETTTSVHTITCIGVDCTYAYSAGAYDKGKFSIFDLTNLDAPTELKTVSSAAGDGHQWDYDDSGLIWHSGFNGIGAFDVSDPLNPVTLNATDKNGQKGKSKYNNFILHNSFRPFAANFTQTADPATGRLDSGAPSLEAGNVLLATEEDYDNPVCGGDAGEGTFSTWHIPYLDAAQYEADNPTKKSGNGKIAPLDNWNTELLDSGTRTPAGALCSAHYFTVDDAGFVAQAWYAQGTRILDVRDPSDIKQVGYFIPAASEVWIPYFVPEYGPDGKQTGRSTDIIYTNDVVRGIDVLRFTPPATAPADTQDVEAPILPQWLTGAGAAPLRHAAGH